MIVHTPILDDGFQRAIKIAPAMDGFAALPATSDHGAAGYQPGCDYQSPTGIGVAFAFTARSRDHTPAFAGDGRKHKVRAEYFEGGTRDGSPIMFLHGGIEADAFEPLSSSKALAGHRLIIVRRPDYRLAPGQAAQASIEADARWALQLLARLDIASAHLAGHSHGALVALEMARISPSSAMSLIMLETGLIAELPSANMAAAALGPVVEDYARGEPREALDGLSLAIFGRPYPPANDSGELENMISDARGTFEGDLAAQQGWRFADALPPSTLPVASITGGASDAHFLRVFGFPAISQVSAMIAAHIPHARHIEIPGVNHQLQSADPDGVAAATAAFVDWVETADQAKDGRQVQAHPS